MESELAPYLPRLLIEWQAQTPEAAFRELEGTLVLVDISGFTRMSERLARKGKVGAEEVTDLLNACFSRLLAVAYDHGGGLLKFGGDALLLFFSGPEHAVRACHAAAGMRRTLRESGRLKTSAGLVSLRMSVGVHSGRFHFFLAGDSHRELIITGPAASETVRMESAAAAGDILLSPATAAALAGDALGAAKAGGYLLKRAPPAPPTRVEVPRIQTSQDLTAFVPLAIRDHVRAALGESEHRQVTVGFIHFAGTDALLAEAGPDEVLRRLDGLICAVQIAVSEHGICFLGTDIDRDGGKVILTAGAPQSAGNDEERMLRALRAIADGQYGLELRLGVNRGHVFAGDVGPPFRRTYTVMGDAVNLAARLMQRAEPGQILAAAAVLERSRTAFETTALEPFFVKGKAQPVVACAVGAASGPRMAHRAQHLPLVGRDQEMKVLLSALESARRGEGKVVELVGEPGLGKSRLVDELRVHCADCACLAATCEEYESSTPYFAFRGLLRSLVGIKPDEGTRRASAKLRQRVRAVAPELPPWLPLLAIPLDLSVGATRETEQLEPAFRKARLHQVVTEFLVKLLSRPTLLVFEDVHWMDEESSDLLRHLMEGLSSRPWLICVTRCPQDSGFAEKADVGSVTIQLEPLPPLAAAALARAATEEVLLPENEVAVLAERAGGNPLFLQELVAGAALHDAVQALPESIEAAITARIDKLAPRERTFLRYASVVGPSFSLDLLASILAGEVADVAEAVVWDRLEEFIDPDVPGSFRFRHALFRDVAYEGLPYRRRRDLHERVGELLERQHADFPDEHAELLSLHFHGAQRYEKAWRYSLIAGERAHAKFANIEAARFYRRALEACRHLGSIDPGEVARVSEALGDVCELAGLYADARGAYRDARRLARSDGIVQARLLRKEGVIRERSGYYTQALRWYGRGLRSIEVVRLAERKAAERVRLSLAYAGVRYRQGRYAECARWCHRATRDAEAIADRASLAHAYYLLDAAYTDLGRPEGARYRALALPIYEELGDLVGQANVLNNLGIDAYYEGKWDEALAFYERSREAREKAGDVVGAATAANNIAEILSDQGRLMEAEALFRQALRVWRAARYPVGVALATSNLGRVAARKGPLDEASRLLNEALLGFREIGAESFVLETEARLAENLILGADHASALPSLTDTLGRTARVGGMTVLQATLHRLRGYALLQAGDPEQAQGCFEESLRLARSVSADYEVALTLEACARLARLTGRGSADAYLAESLSILRRLGVASTPSIPLPE